jgi:methyl-accepting chemotaxis protein
MQPARLVDTSKPNELCRNIVRSDYPALDFDTSLAIFGADGMLESSIGDQEFWKSLAGRVDPLIQAMLENNGSTPFISSTITQPVIGEKMVLVLAVSPGRDRIVAGASSAASLVRHTLTSAFANGPQAGTIVVDSDGNLLYQTGSFSYTGEVTDHPGVAEALRGESGATYVHVGDSEHVVTYSPVAPVGWALVLEEPWETVATPTLRTTQMAPLVLVPALLLTLVALWFGLRQIVQPLQALESKAATLAWGDFKAIEEPVGGIPEIRHLQAELVHMASKVQAAQRSLHDYIGAITAAQEDERRRMARELHDDTIQALIALKQRMQLAKLGPNAIQKTAP